MAREITPQAVTKPLRLVLNEFGADFVTDDGAIGIANRLVEAFRAHGIQLADANDAVMTPREFGEYLTEARKDGE